MHDLATINRLNAEAAAEAVPGCDYHGCEKAAVEMVHDRHFCDEHADEILINETIGDCATPEYIIPCPNCGCCIPVN